MTAFTDEPRWITFEVANAVHDRQLAEHGGGGGVRDAGLLESALAKPMNRWAYGDGEAATLAASYAYGVARNHPFVDGNKRTAWVVARLFLKLNGCELTYTEAQAITMMLSLAAGDVTENELAQWFREHLAAG